MAVNRWLVSLERCYDGSTPDDKYQKGVVIADRREGAHDLIAAANEEWNTTPQEGEVYRIEALAPAPRTYRVGSGGACERLEPEY